MNKTSPLPRAAADPCGLYGVDIVVRVFVCLGTDRISGLLLCSSPEVLANRGRFDSSVERELATTTTSSDAAQCSTQYASESALMEDLVNN